MVNLKNNQYVLFLFRVGFSNGSYATLEKINRFDNKLNIKELIESYESTYDMLSDRYKTEPINEVLFTYQIKTKDLNQKFEKLLNKPTKIGGSFKAKSIKGINFPTNNNYET